MLSNTSKLFATCTITTVVIVIYYDIGHSDTIICLGAHWLIKALVIEDHTKNQCSFRLITTSINDVFSNRSSAGARVADDIAGMPASAASAGGAYYKGV